MRIIAGSARSLPLRAPEGMDTRPTSDQIKETLFNMLQYDIPGCYFLDLFAGSGQIGLESLSRGGEYSVFVENNRKAAKCIEENIVLKYQFIYRSLENPKEFLNDSGEINIEKILFGDIEW